MKNDERTQITPQRLADDLKELRAEVQAFRRRVTDFMLIMVGLSLVIAALFAIAIAATF